MTIAQFLDSLDATENWRLHADGFVMDDNDDCPIWHVYRRLEDDDEQAFDHFEAGRRCGLRTRDAAAIASAADNRGHPRLRKRLLKTLGLA